MKSFAAILIGCLAVFNTPLVEAQQPTMTQLVTENASHAVMFRSVNELKERGDEFAKEMGFTFGMANLFGFAGTQLQVQGAADDNLPCGIMWFEPELIGEPVVKQAWQKPVAVGVAISDTKALAESLKVDHEEFVSGKIVEREDSALGHKHRYYRMVGRYLWIVSHEKLYDVLKGAKPLAIAIPRSRLTDIDSADCLVTVSAKTREFQRDAAEAEAEKWIKSQKDLDAAEKEAIRELYLLVHSASHAVFTARVDRGFEFSVNIFYGQDAPPEIRQRLLKFSPPAVGVSLAGLPSGDLLFGHAAKTDDSLIQPAMTALVRGNRGIFGSGWGWLSDARFVSRFEQLKLLGLFSEIWPLTNRYKVGVYREEKVATHGLVSTASILETDRPDVVISELQSLAAFIDRSALGDVNNEDDLRKTQERVRFLIGQLSDDDYQRRQSAATRLVLIGEPALPQVLEAKLSEKPEVAKRAAQIENLIREELKEKQNKALKSSLLAKAKPAFIFHPAAEERIGVSVDIMEIVIQKNSELDVLLPIIAGAKWSRIRLAKFDKHVVIFFGSNLERLDVMIRNVQSLERGDEISVPEVPYGTPLLDTRGAEFQGSVAKIMQLMNGEHLGEEQQIDSQDPELSSASITIEPDFVTVEWRLSLPDLKAIRKRIF